QILGNLLSNAIKFTPNGGTVRVRLGRTDNAVELVVADTGQGIHSDFLPSVFEPFRQADGSTTRHHGGLGLGLSIVKQLVEAHEGTVRAQSDGEGQGATFIVRLPIVPVSEPELGSGPSPPASASGVAPVSLRGITALVVDDDESSREMIAVILEQHGAQVLTAASAPEAIELLQVARFDVLLADVAMPDEDGYALIRKVRASEQTAIASLPAAALTSLARAEDRRQALQTGFQLHLTKPIDARSLVDAVASLASSQQAGVKQPSSPIGPGA
ncbi:MAG: response regulator, partial [Gemmatimonadetes bacterium]|nr:response regulator [Gemmatimonadota bacterium]